MCYSKEASVRAAIVGFVSSAILYSNAKDEWYKNLAVFFAFVTLMQVYDAIFWDSLSDNKGGNNVNFILTKIAMISNHLQPLVLAYLLSPQQSDTTKYILYAYAIVAIIYSINAYNKIKYTVVTKESYPSLYWEWNSLSNSFEMYSLFLIALTVLAMEMPYPLNYILSIINIATFAFSKWQYKNTDIGRMWCHTASYVPMIINIVQVIHFRV